MGPSKVYLGIFLFCFLGLSSCAGLPFETPSHTPLFGDTSLTQMEIERAKAEKEYAEYLQTIRITQALQTRDIILGMEMDDVSKAWGEPREVEIAGNPSYGNQRWTYFQGLSSRWSTSSARIIYFESGKVIGWQSK